MVEVQVVQFINYENWKFCHNYTIDIKCLNQENDSNRNLRRVLVDAVPTFLLEKRLTFPCQENELVGNLSSI